ncbi:hypothetical protein AB4Z18_14960 [Leifsonia sp. 2TAF2]|uniref:hypothetical protein n=1 Tax=Leifsonia sp. 2TAF2 TaxID=3233009 RepID=UPI003F9814ED
MTTDEQYMDISTEVYAVDPLKRNPPYTVGSRFSVGSRPNRQLYEVVDVETNPLNGFQAAAVAPVVNDRADTSRITVAFAGTNPNHRADVLADVQSVVGGLQGPGTQVEDARLFADRVSKKYQGASMTLTGHSLGGFLALLVGAEKHWSATTFNGPDPWEWLSPEAKAWLQAEIAAGRNPLRNFVNEWDVVGNIYANQTGAAIYVKDRPGRAAFDYHNIENREAFKVNQDGSIAGAGAKAHSLKEIVTNVLDTCAPGMAEALGPALLGLVASLRNPGFMKKVGTNLAGLIVAVNTVSAVSLAASIAGTALSLTEIKLANGRLIPRMEEGLLAAQNAAAMLPYITSADIDACVDMNRLRVHHNIDTEAVHEIDRLVDEQIARVHEIADGINRSVVQAATQDAQWALAFGTR